MADFWIQVRDRKQPYDEIILYQVVNVEDGDAIKGTPSPNSNLACIRIVGCPEHVTKRRLQTLLTRYYKYEEGAEPALDPANGEPLPVSQYGNLRSGLVDVTSLPAPYQTPFFANRTVDIPFEVLVTCLFHRGHGRLLTQDEV